MGISLIDFTMEQTSEIHHENPNSKYFHGFKRGISSRAPAAALEEGPKG